MNEDLKKALESLIDETISEIEELKKSRFSASEVKMHGDDKSQGHLGKDEDADEEDEDEKEMKHKKMGKEEEAEKADDEDEDDKEEAHKSEGKNREADPDGGHHHDAEGAPSVPEVKLGKGEGKNREADPDGGKHKDAEGAPSVPESKLGKGEDKKKKEEEAKKAEPDMGYMKGAMKKHEEELNTLMKSYFEERVAPLEGKLSTILDLVNKLADQPVSAKGVTSRMYQPLTKSVEEVEPLNKSQVSSKLFDLKKSGTTVDSLDVTKAELGQDLHAIVKKYNLA